MKKETTYHHARGILDYMLQKKIKSGRFGLTHNKKVYTLDIKVTHLGDEDKE